MKSLIDNTITVETTEALFEGIKLKNFSQWYKIGKKYYLPIGDSYGVEVDRHHRYFYNTLRNAKDDIKNFEYATLDGRTYFLHVMLHDAEDIFIPIR